MHNRVISLMWFNEIKGGKNHHNLLLVKTERTAHLYSIKVLYIVCLCPQICPKKHACHRNTAYCTRKTKKMCLCAIVYKDLNFIIYEHKKKDLESASITPFYLLRDPMIRYLAYKCYYYSPVKSVCI